MLTIGNRVAIRELFPRIRADAAIHAPLGLTARYETDCIDRYAATQSLRR